MAIPAEKIQKLSAQIDNVTELILQVAKKKGFTVDPVTLKVLNGPKNLSLADQEEEHSADPLVISSTIDWGWKDVSGMTRDSRSTRPQTRELYHLGRDIARKHNPHYKNDSNLTRS